MGLPRAFLDTARALVRANTSPGRGTRAAAEVLAPLYEAAGLPVRRQEDEPGEINLLAGPGGAGSAGADPSRTNAPGGVLLVTFGASDLPSWEGEWLGVPMFFSGYASARNTELVREAGLEIVEDELATIREPEGDAAFHWIMALNRGQA